MRQNQKINTEMSNLPSANKIDKDANFLHFNTFLLVLQIKLQRISQNSVIASHGN